MTEGSSERRDDDRRRTHVLRFPERRTGFDRRMVLTGVPGAAERALRVLRTNDLVLASVLVTFNVLNLMDLVATLRLLEGGRIVEGNPVIGALLGADPLVAAIFKVGLLAAVSVTIWKLRRYRSILALSLVALAGFFLLLSYETLLLSGLL